MFLVEAEVINWIEIVVRSPKALALAPNLIPRRSMFVQVAAWNQCHLDLCNGSESESEIALPDRYVRLGTEQLKMAIETSVAVQRAGLMNLSIEVSLAEFPGRWRPND